MIPENGSRSELKRWLFEELWITDCYYQHRRIVSAGELKWGGHKKPPMYVQQFHPVHSCFYCSAEVGRIVKEENQRLSHEYLNAVIDGTRMWQYKRDKALAA